MSREFLELTDAELWAEVDAAWLLEQFRRSEISEERERKWALSGGHCARFLRGHLEQQMLAALVWGQWLQPLIAEFCKRHAERLSQEPEPGTSTEARALPPRAWHAQLPLNSRALRDHNTKLPRPRLRRSQHR